MLARIPGQQYQFTDRREGEKDGGWNSHGPQQCCTVMVGVVMLHTPSVSLGRPCCADKRGAGAAGKPPTWGWGMGQYYEGMWKAEGCYISETSQNTILIKSAWRRASC